MDAYQHFFCSRTDTLSVNRYTMKQSCNDNMTEIFCEYLNNAFYIHKYLLVVVHIAHVSKAVMLERSRQEEL